MIHYDSTGHNLIYTLRNGQTATVNDHEGDLFDRVEQRLSDQISLAGDNRRARSVYETDIKNENASIDAGRPPAKSVFDIPVCRFLPDDPDLPATSIPWDPPLLTPIKSNTNTMFTNFDNARSTVADPISELHAKVDALMAMLQTLLANKK